MVLVLLVFFFKQKTAYEMRISDWSSDVCSSDLALASPEVSEWTSRPLQRLRLLAQDELLDLAGGGFGQRAEDHFLRRLEAGEALAAEGDELDRKSVG